MTVEKKSIAEFNK